MKSSAFFAIFIPIFASLVSTLFIIFTRDKKPNPKMIKVAYSVAVLGIFVFLVIFIVNYL